MKMPSPSQPTSCIPHPKFFLLVLFLSAILPAWSNQTPPRAKFKAAVYQHAVILPENPKTLVSRDQALSVMRRNLAVYAEQAAAAKEKGADILVFPEDGLYGFRFTWASLTPYLERIPDPTVIDWTPCDDPARFPNSEVQYELSCMAKNNSLYIVANMGDYQPCHFLLDARCDRRLKGQEQHFQYNTDVAFDPSGKLIARYHKQHLFYEDQFDTPAEVEMSTFDTPFGRWGMFTCFDILFYEPAIALVKREGIANIAFPTAWMDALPLLASIEFHSAFARGLGVNFLAANLHLPALRFHGSGVYTPKGMAAFEHNATITSLPRLVVTEIDTLLKPRPESAEPRPESAEPRPEGTEPKPVISAKPSPENPKVIETSNAEEAKDPDGQVSSGTPVPSSHADSESETAFVSALFHDLYNFVQLEKNSDTLHTCHRNVCCHLTYSMTPDPQSPDLWAFGAFDGLHTYEGSYYLQICALVRCANQSRQSCGAPTNQSSTSFQFLSMRGELGTEYVYPEVLLTSESRHLRLAAAEEWTFSSGEIYSGKGFSYPLLAASLFGRYYSRDVTLLPQPDSTDAVIGSSSSCALHVCWLTLTVLSVCVVRLASSV